MSCPFCGRAPASPSSNMCGRALMGRPCEPLPRKRYIVTVRHSSREGVETEDIEVGAEDVNQARRLVTMSLLREYNGRIVNVKEAS